MRNNLKISTMLGTALCVCLFPILGNAQWSGSTVIYPTNINANVGIGTTAPAARLHVKGLGGFTAKFESANANNILGFQYAGSMKGYLGNLTSADDMDFGTYSGNANGKVNLVIGNTPKLTLIPNGAVGIGTQSPMAPLHVKNSGATLNSLLLETAADANKMEFFTKLGNIGYATASTNDMEFGTSGGNTLGKTHLSTNNVRRLSIDAAGAVGIGTQTPGATLHVKGPNTSSTTLRLESGTSSNTAEYLTSTGRKGYTSVSSTDMDLGTNSGGATNLNLVTGGVRQMTIRPSGFVGIGTNSPATQLHIKGTGSSLLRLESSNPSNTVAFYTAGLNSGYLGNTGAGKNMEFGTASTNTTGQVQLSIGSVPQLTVFPNGNVGIGTASDAFKLSVNGTIRAKEVRVESAWADYVFDEGYQLRPLNEVAQYIRENKHLPDVTDAATIQQEGLQVAKQMTEMMRKVEELTLYLIQLDKDNQALKAQIARLEAAQKN